MSNWGKALKEELKQIKDSVVIRGYAVYDSNMDYITFIKDKPERFTSGNTIKVKKATLIINFEME